MEAVRRIDALFDVEREINGLSAARRLAARQERSVPLVGALEGWMRAPTLLRIGPDGRAADTGLQKPFGVDTRGYEARRVMVASGSYSEDRRSPSGTRR